MKLEVLKKEFELCASEQEYYELSDGIQSLGFRACPLNIKCNDMARSICPAKNGNHCRKRFATCWKEYFKLEKKK